jgi:hypothetical protein
MSKHCLVGQLVALVVLLVLAADSYKGVIAGKMLLPIRISAEDSPFGVQDLTRYDPHMADLGMAWARLSGEAGLVWDADEPEPGRYDFNRLDTVIDSFTSHDIHLLATILCYNRWDQGPLPGGKGPKKYGLPKNISAYTDYLKTAVQRYPQIGFYQIENEPINKWSGSPEDFAALIKISSRAINEVSPRAKVVLACAASPESFMNFYVPMLKALNRYNDAVDGQYFHVADMHWSGQFEYRDKSQGNYRTETFPAAVFDLKRVVQAMRREFDDADYSNVPIWITEMSDYSDQPIELNYLYQSEQEHAIEVLKRYVYSLSIGVEKVFWVGIDEHHNCNNSGINNYWDNTGLIHNPKNDGRLHKKLSYYTYKKMVELLKHSDWDQIDILQESDNVFICRFFKHGGPIYIAWNDSDEPKTVSISLGKKIRKVKITKAVPQYSSGEEINDFRTAFETEMRNAIGGRIRIVLNQIPVFVEVN